MLSLDLGRLAREGSVQVEAELPEDDALWEGAGVAWAESVDVRLMASLAGTGEVVVRGGVAGVLAQECRRCLEPVSNDFDQEITAVFVASDTPGAEDDEGVIVYDPGKDIDLGLAVREEVILAVDHYVVCQPECRGLCPSCGTNLNTEPCSCRTEEEDPRWDALRALKEE